METIRPTIRQGSVDTVNHVGHRHVLIVQPVLAHLAEVNEPLRRHHETTSIITRNAHRRARRWRRRRWRPRTAPECRRIYRVRPLVITIIVPQPDRVLVGTQWLPATLRLTGRAGRDHRA